MINEQIISSALAACAELVDVPAVMPMRLVPKELKQREREEEEEDRENSCEIGVGFSAFCSENAG